MQTLKRKVEADRERIIIWPEKRSREKKYTRKRENEKKCLSLNHNFAQGGYHRLACVCVYMHIHTILVR